MHLKSFKSRSGELNSLVPLNELKRKMKTLVKLIREWEQLLTMIEPRRCPNKRKWLLYWPSVVFFYADLIRPQASKIRCFSDASFHRFGSGHTCKPSIRQRKILSLEIHALKQIWRPINWIKTFKKTGLK